MCFEYLWHKIEFYLIFSICSIREAFGIWNSEIKTVMVFQLPSCVWLCNPHGVQHTRLPCPSLSPGVCSNSCPLSHWCHPTISSFVTPSPPAPNLSQHQGLFQCTLEWEKKIIRHVESKFSGSLAVGSCRGEQISNFCLSSLGTYSGIEKCLRGLYNEVWPLSYQSYSLSVFQGALF